MYFVDKYYISPPLQLSFTSLFAVFHNRIVIDFEKEVYIFHLFNHGDQCFFITHHLTPPFIALSSLSTYLYSEYLVFGDTMGFILDVITVCSWQIVIPLGVMGIWTLMSEIRLYIIIAVLLASVVLHLVSDRKEAAR